MSLTPVLERFRRDGLVATLRLLTIEQWAAIDAEYWQLGPSKQSPGKESPASEAAAGETGTTDTSHSIASTDQTPVRDIRSLAGQLFLVALMLTLQKYFGHRRFLEDAGLVKFSQLQWGGLWGQVYWAWFSSFTYLVPPMLYAWWTHKDTPAHYGLSLKGAREHLPVYLLLFAGVFPFVVIASGNAQFLQRYPFYANAGNSWPELIIWELSYGFQFLALEYFFRGFMLFPLARQMGAAAIFVMAVPYCMIHFAKPFPETVGAIFAGTILGTLALRTRSVLGGVLIHLAVAWSMDLLALWRKGALTHLF